MAEQKNFLDINGLQYLWNKIIAKLSHKVDDVQINGTSITNNSVADIPIAGLNILGVVKSDNTYGIDVNSNGRLQIARPSSNHIKAGTNEYKPIVPNSQHESTFYGLAKASGDTTQSQSSNAVGTYTDEAKASIKSMLGVTDPVVNDVQINGASIVQNGTANIPIAVNKLGAVRVNTDVNSGIYINPISGEITTSSASNANIKEGTNIFRPLSPSTQHVATFYGLAKAAGDTTQSNSSNPVGTYTDEAKVSIKSMLGVEDPDYPVTDVQVDGSSIVQDGVAEIPVASEGSGLGVIAINPTYGIATNPSNGQLKTNQASSSDIKAGNVNYKPVTSIRQHEATFYGLAKAAGDTTQSQSSNAVGSYTDEAKSAIKEMIGVEEAPVQDVQVNGASVLTDGVANVPMANANTYGVVRPDSDYGTQIVNNRLASIKAADDQIKAGTHQRRPIVPSNQHISTFYGLAKVAGADEKDSTLAVGTYTDTAKGAIQKMLGMDGILGTDESDLTASKAYAVGDVFIANGKMYKVTTAIAADGAIVTEGTGQNAEEITVADDFVKKDDYATNIRVGVVKINGKGLAVDRQGLVNVDKALISDSKTGTESYKPICPISQHVAVFYGLAKAAGDTTQSQSDNAVGTYTDDAKIAIKTMLGVVDPAVDDVQINGTSIVSNGVAEIPEAANATFGVIKYYTDGSEGIAKSPSQGRIVINKANSTQIKAGTEQYRPIVPSNEHESTFYGLAKAAGDTTQSQSSNAVGTYTPEAKAAIKQMLGVSDLSTDITVSETEPTITALANTRYLCGEVTSIDFTPSATGICEVIFTSGSAVALLTLPSTVKMPEWFDATALETDTIYDISIVDGVYGAVMTWQV